MDNPFRRRRTHPGKDDANLRLGLTSSFEPSAAAGLPRRTTSPSELHGFGADASELLKSRPDPTRPHDGIIPSMLADVVMAILLTLPRRAGAPDQPLGEECHGGLRSAWRDGAKAGRRTLHCHDLSPEPASPHYTPSRCGPRNP